MIKSVEELIVEANRRLKAGRCGLSIVQRENRLFLRGTLPPKPGTNKTRPYQQYIRTGLLANHKAVAQAEKEAKIVSGLIASKTFEWEPYLSRNDLKKLSPIAEDVIRSFEDFYFSTRKRNEKSEITWLKDYKSILKRIPGEREVTIDLLKSVIESIPIDKPKARNRACFVLNSFASFLDLNVDFKKYKVRYERGEIDPRTVPDDESIVKYHNQICGNKNISDDWKFAYGILATYGLRPSELFYVDLNTIREPPGIIYVSNSKSGKPREVYPCYPEWWEQWKLYEAVIPNCSGTDLGHRVSTQFRRYNLPFSPYGLRHAWAIRTISFGWEDSFAAKQMDHSVVVHNKDYHRWISARDLRRRFDVLMMNPNRPKPPE